MPRKAKTEETMDTLTDYEDQVATLELPEQTVTMTASQIEKLITRKIESAFAAIGRKTLTTAEQAKIDPATLVRGQVVAPGTPIPSNMTYVFWEDGRITVEPIMSSIPKYKFFDPDIKEKTMRRLFDKQAEIVKASNLPDAPKPVSLVVNKAWRAQFKDQHRWTVNDKFDLPIYVSSEPVKHFGDTAKKTKTDPEGHPQFRFVMEKPLADVDIDAPMTVTDELPAELAAQL